MDENDMIWVEPGGMRVRGRGSPGGYWECDGDGTLFDDRAAHDQMLVDQANEPQPGDADYTGPGGIDYWASRKNEETAKNPQSLEEFQRRREERDSSEEIEAFYARMAREYEAMNPSLLTRFRRTLGRLFAPVPCLSVWAGLIGTYFWNSMNSMPEQPFEAFIELPEDFPAQLAASIGATAIFVVWTWCFRHTIREAIRKEFAESK